MNGITVSLGVQISDVIETEKSKDDVEYWMLLGDHRGRHEWAWHRPCYWRSEKFHRTGYRVFPVGVPE